MQTIQIPPKVCMYKRDMYHHDHHEDDPLSSFDCFYWVIPRIVADAYMYGACIRTYAHFMHIFVVELYRYFAMPVAVCEIHFVRVGSGFICDILHHHVL